MATWTTDAVTLQGDDLVVPQTRLVRRLQRASAQSYDLGGVCADNVRFTDVGANDERRAYCCAHNVKRADSGAVVWCSKRVRRR